MQKRVLFHRGQVVNGTLILDIENKNNIQDQRYTVRHECCGSVLVYMHKNMVRRVNNKTSLCAACAARKGLQAIRESAEKPTPTPEQTYVKGWGYTLGKMGKSRVCEYGEIHETGGKLNE